jgi:hypothetical protein
MSSKQSGKLRAAATESVGPRNLSRTASAKVGFVEVNQGAGTASAGRAALAGRRADTASCRPADTRAPVRRR